MKRRLELSITGEILFELSLVVACKGGELRCDEHEVGSTGAIICDECKLAFDLICILLIHFLGEEAICFKHLLSLGVHSSEATFSQEIDGNWHHIHTEWSRKWHTWQSRPNHAVDDVHDKILTIAASYTTCKPLNPAQLRLGFYDKKDETVGIITHY
jgi:hypothetical protein